MKEEFIKFLVKSNVLKFGEFITKSGRKTPFFINTGSYVTGSQMSKLGAFYAESIKSNFGEEWDVLYGPAYKGIPLSSITIAKLYEMYKIDKKFCFNRKEQKDHGEGGSIIGYIPQDNDGIIIIEDVITAGTSVRESIDLLKKIADIRIVGLIVSVDRMEKGKTDKSALMEVSEEFGIKTVSIVNIEEIVQFLYNKEIDGKVYINDEMIQKIRDYRSLYGV
ncbi:MAG: orotate phosphoribosyltransferase [Brevinematales bacterium]|nr:orotate phosphoribosyltransferase [Brevinematales bacterium]